MNKKVPKRRFQEFNNAVAWERRKFIEIINRLSKTSNSSILPKVEYEDIIAEEGRLNKDISNKFDSRKGILFQPNNILYGKLRPYLKNWLYPDFKGVAVGDFWVFEAIEATPRFIYNLIQSDSYQKAANDTAGTKMPRSDWTKVSNSSFFIPEESSEQKRIGTFFKQLDNTIALHQRKLEKIKALKTAYLSEMFPAEGETKPKRRFAGFTDDWEQRKLEDILDVRSGRDYKHLDSGDIPVYGTGGYMLSVGEALSYEEDAIGIGRKGTIDKPYILKAPFWTVDTLFYTVPKRDSDLNFIHSIFQKINWKSKDESTGVPSLSKTTINAVSVFTPSCSEQKEIGTFFNKLDDTIALHQRKLQKLQNIKKAYLNEMFI
ncbi:restriction endonuclease subunit S [Listeria marthii]|nr:restriction endonuclease subunit S [Listeria marthii]